MQKILHYVSIMNRAGEETFLMNVFRKIDREKVQFDFLCTSNKKGNYDAEIKQLGGHIYYVNLLQGSKKQLSNFFILKNRLKALVKTHSCFEIHTQHAMDAFLSSVAAKQAGFKKVIVHSHNSSTIYNIYTHKIFRILLKELKITRFACSQEAGHWMFGGKAFSVIKNGIDLNQFRFNVSVRKKVRKEMNWENKFIVGHVGRFNEQKNHIFLLNSFYLFQKTVPDSLLVLIGEGELKNRIQQDAQKLGIQSKIQFLGVREDVNNLYQGMDLFAFPSLFEGLPVVLVEVQAAGLPAVISDSITKEIDINNNLIRLSINDTENKWAVTFRKIARKKLVRISNIRKLKEAGYDIKDVAKGLQDFYLKQ